MKLCYLVVLYQTALGVGQNQGGGGGGGSGIAPTQQNDEGTTNSLPFGLGPIAAIIVSSAVFVLTLLAIRLTVLAFSIRAKKREMQRNTGLSNTMELDTTFSNAKGDTSGNEQEAAVNQDRGDEIFYMELNACSAGTSDTPKPTDGEQGAINEVHNDSMLENIYDYIPDNEENTPQNIRQHADGRVSQYELSTNECYGTNTLPAPQVKVTTPHGDDMYESITDATRMVSVASSQKPVLINMSSAPSALHKKSEKEKIQENIPDQDYVISSLEDTLSDIKVITTTPLQDTPSTNEASVVTSPLSSRQSHGSLDNTEDDTYIDMKGSKACIPSSTSPAVANHDEMNTATPNNGACQV